MKELILNSKRAHKSEKLSDYQIFGRELTTDSTCESERDFKKIQ